MGQRLQVAMSWLMVGFVFSMGLFTTVLFGMAWMPLNDHLPGAFLRWLTFAGIGLLGIGLLAASIAAPRSRRLAGMICLGFLAPTAFCLAYERSGFLVWYPNGDGVFETPTPFTAIGLTALFFLPFAAAGVLRRNKRRATLASAMMALIAAVVYWRCRWTPVLLPHLAGASLPFLLPALFWLGTHKRGWSELRAAHPPGLGKRLVRIGTVCLVVFCLDAAGTVGLSALQSSLATLDCGKKAPFDRQREPGEAVFTARVIHAGRSLSAMAKKQRGSNDAITDPRVGDWAIATVQEKFWGLPWLSSRYVLLTNYVYWKGETYFIDGQHEHGFASRFLPIVEGGAFCRKTGLLQEAAVELRLLHNDRGADGGRILGYVRQPGPFQGIFAPPVTPQFLAGAKIDVSGPNNTRTVTTDEGGNYDLKGLPAGDYVLRLQLPANQIDGSFLSDGSQVKVHLNEDQIAEQDFWLVWNGRISGRVRDDAGNPAHVWVSLESTNGRALPAGVNSFQLTKPNGSYEIARIPPGSYRLTINPYGPDKDSPYEAADASSAEAKPASKTVTLTEGQEIRGFDFPVKRLDLRMVPVRVLWPDGSPATGASVAVVYEHAEYYDRPDAAMGIVETDVEGAARLPVYGNSKVRITAYKFVLGGEGQDNQSYRSKVAEFESAKLPGTVEIVLESKNP